VGCVVGPTIIPCTGAKKLESKYQSVLPGRGVLKRDNSSIQRRWATQGGQDRGGVRQIRKSWEGSLEKSLEAHPIAQCGKGLN